MSMTYDKRRPMCRIAFQHTCVNYVEQTPALIPKRCQFGEFIVESASPGAFCLLEDTTNVWNLRRNDAWRTRPDVAMRHSSLAPSRTGWFR